VRVIRHRAIGRLRECMESNMGPRRDMGPRLRGDDV
jgi:hypothetical protein